MKLSLTSHRPSHPHCPLHLPLRPLLAPARCEPPPGKVLAVTFSKLRSSSLTVPTAPMTSTLACHRFSPAAAPLRRGQAHPVSPLLSTAPNVVCRPANLLPDPSPLHLDVGSRRDLAGHHCPVKPGALRCSATSWAERPKWARPLPWPGGPCHYWRSPTQPCHFSFSN
jgi:hypothetical protein